MPSSKIIGGGGETAREHSGYVVIAAGVTGTLATITPSSSLRSIRLDKLTTRSGNEQGGISIESGGITVISNGAVMSPSSTSADKQSGRFGIGSDGTSTVGSLLFPAGETVTITKNAGNTTEIIVYAFSEIGE